MTSQARSIHFPWSIYPQSHLENVYLDNKTKDHTWKEIDSTVKLLIQPEDITHDNTSKLKLKICDRKFRGTNFIYTLKTQNEEKIPVFVHSHHIHQHEKAEKFGIKTPIFIDHLVCF